MDFEAIARYIPLYNQAAILTVTIGWIGIVGAIIIGLIASLIGRFQVPVLRVIARIYIEVFRNTPLLIQLFFIYFGLPRLGIHVSAAFCGAFGLAIHGGAYMAEAFRAGFETVADTQRRSALALGFTRLEAVRYVTLPQAVMYSTPAFVSNIMFLLKETSVFSAISLMDLMFTTKDLMGLYYDTTECLFLLIVFYLLILIPINLVIHFIERRMRYGTFGD